MRPRHRRSQGFTLLELMTVCAIAAVVAGLSVPTFQDYLLNARRTDQINGLLRALHAARSAAITQGEAVVLCKSRDGRQCSARSQWNEGWIAFVNKNRDSPPSVNAGEPILLHQAQVQQLSIRANRDAIVYWPFSLAGTTASFVFCDKRGSPAARAVVLSQTGRPRTSDRDSAGQPLRCVEG